MSKFKNFHLISYNPLSRFPKGGKAKANAPSPVGEVPIAIGREGGNNYSKVFCFNHDSRYSNK